MRARLTLAFVCLALVLAVVVGSARSASITEMVRTAQLDQLTATARVIATLVEDLDASGSPITRERLAPYVPAATELTLERATGTVVIPGADFDPDVGEQATRVRERVGSSTVALVQGENIARDLAYDEQRTLIALMVLMVMMSGVAGYVVATLLARPFQQLARSAAALGRGRYDIEPPRSRIPEVVSIADSLRAGAAQLQESMRRDREFVQHTSHVLRTPLTGMRLELEELSLRTDLDDEVRRTTDRCLLDVERLDSTVTELLAFARGRQVVAGAEVTLVVLGYGVAQRWRDQLPESREVKAYIDDGPDTTLTPGPVEQLLDVVLTNVVERTDGPVTLRFAGVEQHVRILVQAGSMRSGLDDWTDSAEARAQVDVLGGRCSGNAAKGELEILLPRR